MEQDFDFSNETVDDAKTLSDEDGQIRNVEIEVVERDRLLALDDPAHIPHALDHALADVGQRRHQCIPAVAGVLALLDADHVLGQRNLRAVLFDEPVKQVLLGCLDDGGSIGLGVILLDLPEILVRLTPYSPDLAPRARTQLSEGGTGQAV